jgi:hypothetical protein
VSTIAIELAMVDTFNRFADAAGTSPEVVIALTERDERRREIMTNGMRNWFV